VLDPDLVNGYTTGIAGRREFPTHSICDPHLVLHGRAAGSSTMDVRPEHRRREPRMDTERDMTIETDEDHIVRGLD
jgi:hypothetical protein